MQDMRCVGIRTGRCLAAPIMMLLALACRPAPTSDESPPAPPAAVAMNYLGPDKPSFAAPVSAADLHARPQFAIVEIASVDNPRRVPLIFSVSFRPAEGEDVMLGTFSLYPANNPGRFIVATQGKVMPGGEIAVTLNDAAAEGMADVRVGVSSLSLGPR